jgi:ATP-dependent Clp protease ATP-binding subunit ClpA
VHAKDALQSAFTIAQNRKADSIGSDHVLVSLLTEEQGAGVLAGLGVTIEATDAHLDAVAG